MGVPMFHKALSKKNIFIVGIILLWILINLIVLRILVFNWPKIFPNIFIEAFYVGGLTPEEARIKIEELFKGELDNFSIELVYENKSWQLSYEDLGIYYEFDDYIKEAYEIGRVGGYYERIKTIYGLARNPIKIRLKPRYNLVKIENKIREISDRINEAPVDATIDRVNGKFLIKKETLGIEVDKDLVQDKIISSIENLTIQSIEIPIINTQPRIMEKDLREVKDLIGEYSTVFDLEEKNRTENIKLAANSINNTLLLPGEEFSFNETTGPRTAEGGYKEAPVIINGEFVPDIGGGICQVSTTLYQAALRADTEITSRQNHGLPVGYVPLGQDAAVAYGYIDFKFKNNKDYPIYIESYLAGNRLFIKLYGKKTDRISIDLRSEITEVLEPNIKIKEDPNIRIGETILEVPGRKGYRVATYKVYLEDGKEIKRELISKSYYPPKDGLMIRGSKH